ncbi:MULTISPECIES: GNAT family N-acetyltransferase [Bacillus]|uniref:GNAT family N-acetyltransferase n=1 Tax=Bacillus TaxID=1386 RepID=UPI0003170B86|nr:MULTISPECIES: GNAT family N-acetyltransferase [Bacillus]
MSLRICEVTADNWVEVALLSVDEQQKDFIESNSFSLAQSRFEPQWQSLALYDDDTIIGYAMCGKDISNGDVWLDRFMIDQKQQGKGYGKRTLPMLIDYIKKRYQCEKIYLSISPDNKIAQKLYEQFGFNLNGDIDNSGVISGLVMVLDETNTPQQKLL